VAARRYQATARIEKLSPRLYEEQQMEGDFPPFEVLKLIRDRIITNVNDLDVHESRFYINKDHLVKALLSLGWIELTKDGKITPTERIGDVQEALGFSLTKLSPYRANSVVCTPVFGRPSQPPTPADVFVLMPFTDELKPIYEDHIKAVTQRLGLTAVRADDFFAANSIMSDVWNAINQARILIADCTGRNPNVFYELGIAHTLGKPVILIAQSADDIPFDIRHIRTIVYNFTPRGMREFESAVAATLETELAQPRTISEWLARKRERSVNKALRPTATG
jgi:nucleoside 2-deoxyribosyltransferase